MRSLAHVEAWLQFIMFLFSMHKLQSTTLPFLTHIWNLLHAAASNTFLVLFRAQVFCLLLFRNAFIRCRKRECHPFRPVLPPPRLQVNRGTCRFGRYKNPRRPHPPPRASRVSHHPSQVSGLTHAHLPSPALTHRRPLDQSTPAARVHF